MNKAYKVSESERCVFEARLPNSFKGERHLKTEQLKHLGIYQASSAQLAEPQWRSAGIDPQEIEPNLMLIVV